MSWDKFEKLTELIKRRVAHVVQHRLKDPRVGFVTITKIDLSRDMKQMKVFYSVLGSKPDVTKTTCALEDARGFIQREVAKTMRIRTMPAIRFLPDETMEKVERVEQILQTISEEKSRDDEEGEPDDSTENDPTSE